MALGRLEAPQEHDDEHRTGERDDRRDREDRAERVDERSPRLRRNRRRERTRGDSRDEIVPGSRAVGQGQLRGDRALEERTEAGDAGGDPDLPERAVRPGRHARALGRDDARRQSRRAPGS